MAEIVLRAEPSEREDLLALARELDGILVCGRPPRLTGPDGHGVELPAAALKALRLIVNAMAHGQSLTLVPDEDELTTQEAADLLNVSRAHLIKLMEAGELPFHRAGTNRPIRIEDLLAYQDRRDQMRRAALDELDRVSDEPPEG